MADFAAGVRRSSAMRATIWWPSVPQAWANWGRQSNKAIAKGERFMAGGYTNLFWGAWKSNTRVAVRQSASQATRLKINADRGDTPRLCC